MKKLLLFTVVLLTAGTIHADEVSQSIKASVIQDEETKEASKLSLSKTSIMFQFDSLGYLIATPTGSDALVAKLPIATSGATMYVDLSDLDATKKSVTMNNGLATVSSAFQLVVPEGATVIAPRYNATTQKLDATEQYQLAPGTVVPPYTGLLVVSSSESCDFSYTVSETPATVESSLQAAVVDEYVTESVYTLQGNGSTVSFSEETVKLNAGEAYLTGAEINFGSSTTSGSVVEVITSIEQVLESTPLTSEKMYNLWGQRAKENQPGIVIVNGKKMLKL